jgi:hypothetical protein
MRLNEGEQLGKPQLKIYQILILILLCLLVLSISGVGGYGYQDTDWFKHNTILKDLIDRPWPVSYQIDGEEVALVYYLAYYLPAALVGKLVGWQIANHVLFIWSFLGLVLAALWFVNLSRPAVFSALVIFFTFSGLDIIGRWLLTPAVAAIRPEAEAYLIWNHIESWSIGWQYSSNITLLFWVPHQALAGWIASGLLGQAYLFSSSRKNQLYYCGLTALWSPFVTLGMFPYCVAEILAGEGGLWQRLGKYLNLSNLSGAALLLAVGMYFSSKFYQLPGISGKIPFGFSLSFAADDQARMIGMGLILVFCLLEFGLLGILLFRIKQVWNRKTKILLITTLITLLLLPLFLIGEANDLVMRASIPPLFFLALLLSRSFLNKPLTPLMRVILIGLILLGSATPLIEINRHLTEIQTSERLVSIPSYLEIMDLWNPALERSESIALQYLGSSTAPFFRYLARTD